MRGVSLNPSLNLAEALNRVKHSTEYIQGESEKIALQTLAAAETKLLDDLTSPKLERLTPVRLLSSERPAAMNFDQVACYLYTRLPEAVLRANITEDQTTLRVNGFDTLSHIVGNSARRSVPARDLYIYLTHAIWDVERINHTTPDKRYLDILGRMRKFSDQIT